MRNELVYEKNQDFNFINRYLHSFRFRWISSIIESLKKNNKDEKITIVDIGCGTCKLFGILQKQNLNFNYVGVEPLDEFVEVAKKRYGNFKNFSIIHSFIENSMNLLPEKIDLFTAMESFEHIPEYLVPSILKSISEKKPKLLAISVPVEIGPSILIKNLGSKLMGYCRHKEYTWKETFLASIYLLEKIPAHTTGHKGFDWRWLKHNIRQYFYIKKINKSPYNFIPSALAPSICFTGIPKEEIKVLDDNQIKFKLDFEQQARSDRKTIKQSKKI